MTEFFSVNRELAVSEAQRQQALLWCTEAGKEAILACMIGWVCTDFRADLKRVSLPALVSRRFRRFGDALPGSELCVIAGGPHGCNISHPDEFNEALVGLLASAGLPRPAGDQQLTLRMFRCARRRGSHDRRPITALEGNFGV